MALPWTDSEAKNTLLNNYHSAALRFENLKRRLARDEELVGSLLRYFNVAVIPGFPDARICGRLPRFGTLVPGA